MTSAISLTNISKHYGDVMAVRDLNLEIAEGEVMGFLGPNGAGKTTTIHLLMGFLRPTTGHVRLLGYDMSRPQEALKARERLGFVPDVAGLDPTATGWWLLQELAHMQQRPAVDQAELIARLELSNRDLKRPMGQLSRGTRQKINIVQGLQHRPDLLILDEPTEGLDPLSKRALFELLRAAQSRGATIFFSSHILNEVEELCDRMALIRAGRLVAVDRINHLRSHLHRRVRVLFNGIKPDVIGPQLAALPTIHSLHYDDDTWSFSIQELGPLMRLLAETPLQDVAIEPPSLEDVFLQYYKHEGTL